MGLGTAVAHSGQPFPQLLSPYTTSTPRRHDECFQTKTFVVLTWCHTTSTRRKSYVWKHSWCDVTKYFAVPKLSPCRRGVRAVDTELLIGHYWTFRFESPKKNNFLAVFFESTSCWNFQYLRTILKGFWETVCNTVRPMLLDRCPVCLFCLSVYPVCDVGVLCTNGWMDQDATW